MAAVRPGRLLVILLLAGLYFFAGKFGLSLAFLHPSASPVWIPTGLAIASMLLVGYWVWPGIFIGAFLVNIFTAGTVATSLAIAAGNTLEALSAAYLINRFAHGLQVFEKPADVGRFATVCLISTALCAAVGVTALAAAGFAPWQRYGSIWATWWLGDLVGALTITPVLVAWTLEPVFFDRKRTIEILALYALIFSLAVVSFSGRSGVVQYVPNLFHLPIIIWAAFRFGLRGVTLFTFTLSAAAVWGTLAGFGPFASFDPNTALLMLQAFMGTIALTGLVLASLVRQQRVAEERMAVSLKEKEVLMREVHHRVKNNLQVICSLLTLQSGLTKDAEALALLEESENRIRSMALVHEQLCRSKDMAHIPMQEYLPALVRQIKEGNALYQVPVHVSCDPILLTVDECVPLGLVINELLVNAFEHAFPSKAGGQIKVQMQHLGPNYVLAISDTGKGFAAGFSLETVQSLGLGLVKELVDQLRGKIEFSSNAGASFRIIFPPKPLDRPSPVK